MLRLSFRTCLALAAIALFVGTASAAPITGTLNISGDMRIVSTTAVDFAPPLGGPSGDFTVDVLNQLGFFAALAGTTGDVGDLSAGDPIDAAFSRPGWLTFDADPLAAFTLTFRDPGLFGSADCFAVPAAGQQCTPTGSFLSLTNLPGNMSALSFTVSGIGVGTAGELNPMTGTFATLYGGSYQELLTVLAAGGSVDISYTANFVVEETTTTVPEPGTGLLMLAGAAAALRRFRRPSVAQN